MCNAKITIPMALGVILMASACQSTEAPNAPAPDLACVQITGAGTTNGDRNLLKGDGVFRFGDTERAGKVGLYLFAMTPAVNDGFDVDTQYQFHWDGGDSFLTKDQVYFEPVLEPDTYRFSVQMTIVVGSGIFAGMIGQKPLVLTAEMKFGPPANPGDAMTAVEQFEVGGTICD